MSMSKFAYDPKTVCAHHIRGSCRYGDKCFKLHLPLEVFFAFATMSHNLEARGGDPTKIGTNDTNFAITRQQQLDAEKRIRQTPGFEKFQAKNMHLWDDQERIEAEKADVDEMIAKDKEPAIVAALHGLIHFDNMIAAAELAEQSIQDQFDAFVAENEIHQERANALIKQAPGAPIKADEDPTVVEARKQIAAWGTQLNFSD
jgi:hypothetical protein